MTRTARGRLGVCPRCFQVAQLTRHHCLPVRFFGKNHYVIHLCAECHDDIEQILPRSVKLHRDLYLYISKEFVMGNQVTVSDITERRPNNGQLRIFRFQGNQPNAV
jgi:hypothetical protein